MAASNRRARPCAKRADRHGHRVRATKACTRSSRGSIMTVPPLRKRPAWALLEKHYRSSKRRAAAATFRGGSRARREPSGEGGGTLPRLLQEPHHRRDPDAAAAASRGIGAARAHRGDVPRREHQRLREPRGAARRAARAAGRHVSSTTATTWCPRCTTSSTRWPNFADRRRAAATGRAIPANASATSSISASADPIWDRSWPMRRCNTYSDAR